MRCNGLASHVSALFKEMLCLCKTRKQKYQQIHFLVQSQSINNSETEHNSPLVVLMMQLIKKRSEIFDLFDGMRDFSLLEKSVQHNTSCARRNTEQGCWNATASSHPGAQKAEKHHKMTKELKSYYPRC